VVNQLSHYKQVLAGLREKTNRLASEYIPELYYILKDEEQRSPEDCRAIIERDCGDMWSEDTIRKYLPPEAKNATKWKAGTISAEVKKKKKKERKQAAKPLVANTSDSGQFSVLIDSGSDTGSSNSVEINPTENGSVGQSKQESKSFQEVIDGQHSANVWTEDYFLSLIAERRKDEALDREEDSIDECINKYLLLPSELAERICLDVNESRTSGIIPNFELEHDGIRIVSVRTLDTKENHAETHDPSRGNKK
jgi:hypothetical protein